MRSVPAFLAVLVVLSSLTGCVRKSSLVAKTEKTAETEELQVFKDKLVGEVTASLSRGEAGTLGLFQGDLEFIRIREIELFQPTKPEETALEVLRVVCEGKQLSNFLRSLGAVSQNRNTLDSLISKNTSMSQQFDTDTEVLKLLGNRDAKGAPQQITKEETALSNMILSEFTLNDTALVARKEENGFLEIQPVPMLSGRENVVLYIRKLNEAKQLPKALDAFVKERPSNTRFAQALGEFLPQPESSPAK